MQVISDLQQRPSKNRLGIEKGIVPFYDLCTIVQVVCFIMYTASLTISSGRTFDKTIWQSNDLILVDSLVYKTANCTYTGKDAEVYFFKGFDLVLYSTNVDTIFADMAIQMRLAVFISATAIIIGVMNRSAVESNFFSFEWRNFVIHKDILSAAEIPLLAFLLQTAFMARAPCPLLVDYLQSCGVERDVFLPFLSLTPLYVLAFVGFLTYLVGIPIYLNNALPKYGIMTEEQIADYKVWLRNRQAALERARILKEEARLASMEMHRMLRDPYDATFPTPRSNAAGQDPLNASTGFAMSLPPDGVDYDYAPYSSSVNMPRRREAFPTRTPRSVSTMHSTSYQQPRN